MTDLFIKVKIHQEQQLPFVLFCKPNSDTIIGLFQKNDHLYFLDTFDEKGFVFAPFDSEQIPYIPLEYSDIYFEKTNESDYFVTSHMHQKSDLIGNDFFEEIVTKAIRSINEDIFLKVVLSRKEAVVIPEFDIALSLKRAISCYPNAFKYCFFHPKVGMWFGATPEQLIKVNKNSIMTVALAGTQLVSKTETVVWGEKEKKEQQLVTNYITANIQDLTKELKVSNPYSFKAGDLWHIKTDIFALLKSKKYLKKLIFALHPTPAVCGLPKANALEFIMQNEGYNREYYSGYLGELNIDFSTFKMDQTDLYVNLRCMKINKNKSFIYVGCGITTKSNPKEEYIETVNKAMTMKKILNL